MSPDVIVVGGGVIGTSISYQLAKRGARVMLLERDSLGAAATGASAGIIQPHGGADAVPEFTALAVESARLFPAVSAELKQRTGFDVGYRPVDVIELALDEAEETRLRRQMDRGAGDAWIDAAIALEIEPEINASIRGAVLHRGDAQVLPAIFTRALGRAAAELGAEVREGVAVDRLLIDGDTVRGVAIGSENIHASEVVVANGCWSAAWSSMLRLPIPVRPVRGQMVALAVTGRSPHAVLSGGGGYLVPKPDGRLLLGTTVEDAGFDPRPTVEGIASLLDRAPRLAPRLAGATVGAAWAGLRPGTADGLPIIGRVAGWDGVTLATGHFRNGILLAPITAELVADLLLEGRTRLPTARFDPARFLPHAA
ncbi:MAG TPA: glycine oxidase ThiO [Candidatus Dormibacteraeota bacterium]